MTPTSRYRVVNSGFVADQFRELLRRTTHPSQRSDIVEAARWIIEELARTPDEFGESQETLPGTGWILRRGFAPPLFVEYAIDEPNRLVYLKRFWLRT